MLLKSINWKFRLFFIFIYVSFIYMILRRFILRDSIPEMEQIPLLSRVFIFVSENRPIVNGRNDYHTLSALINFVYARRYKYTFKYFRINYNNTRNLTHNVPSDPSCFNQVLNQERSIHWAKLQVIWHVLETYSSTHDLFIYLDSDAVINNHNMILSKFLANLSWVFPSKCKDFHITSCHVAFLYDTWNRNDTFVVPNSGIFLFQATAQFRQFIQVWWHLNVHESNFFGCYEQDSLWNLLENLLSPWAPAPTSEELAARQVWNTKVKSIFHRDITKYVGIMNVKSFGNTNPYQFFVHMTSGLGMDQRQPELFNIWKRIHGNLNQTQLLVEIERQCVVQFDTASDRIPWNFAVST